MRLFQLLLVCIAASGCRPAEADAEAPVMKETAEDQILRIGSTWRAVERDKGLRSAPDPISSFEFVTESEFSIKRGQKRSIETGKRLEGYTHRDGLLVTCRVTWRRPLALRFAYRSDGMPGVELATETTTPSRTCDGPAPGTRAEIPGARARFILESDTLKAFEPRTETRIYRPVD